MLKQAGRRASMGTSMATTLVRLAIPCIQLYRIMRFCDPMSNRAILSELSWGRFNAEVKLAHMTASRAYSLYPGIVYLSFVILPHYIFHTPAIPYLIERVLFDQQ